MYLSSDTSKATIFALCSVSALQSFLPYVLGLSLQCEVEPSEYNGAVSSDIVKHMNFSMMVVSLMLSFEALLDYNALDLPAWIVHPRCLLILGHLSTSVVLYAVDNVDHRQLVLAICCHYARNSIFCGCVLIQFFNDTRTANMQRYLIVIFAILISTNIYYLWYPFVITSSAVHHTVHTILVVICCAMALLYCGDGLRMYITVLRPGQSATVIEKYTMLNYLCVGVFFFGIVIVNYAHDAPTWSSASRSELAWYLGLHMTILVAEFLIPTKMAQHKAALMKGILKSKKNFVRYISHEIRTPLNTVYMGLQLLSPSSVTLKSLSTGSDTRSQVQSTVSDLCESCETAIEILNDLLLYDKIEEGNLILFRETVVVSSFLRKIIKPFEIQAAASSVALEFDEQCSNTPLSCITISVDNSKFSQVLRNLISNALKFTPSFGRVTVKCSFIPECVYSRSFSGSRRERSRQFHTLVHNVSNVQKIYCGGEVSPGVSEKGRLRIEVKDSGPGILPENQGKLFNSIVQFDAAALQNGKGSGLGLYLTNAIIQRHGGSIGVVSSGIPGEGSLFYVEIEALRSLTDLIHANPDKEASMSSRQRIPLLPVNGASVTSNCSDLQLSSFRHMSGSCSSEILETPKVFSRALVCDDSRLNRKMIAAAIKNRFDAIDQAENGAVAVEMVRNSLHDGNLYSVVFMDCVMPVMNGLDATREMRSLGFEEPIIAVTGNALQDDITAFRTAGANRVISKPINISSLEEVFRDIARTHINKTSVQDLENHHTSEVCEEIQVSSVDDV